MVRREDPPPITPEDVTRIVNAAVEAALAGRPGQEEVGQLRAEIETLRAQANAAPQLTPEQREEMRQMREEINRLRAATGGRQAAPPRGSPFTPEILAAPLPANFQFPDIGKYSGTTDPKEHLARFDNAATLYACSDEIKCRCFPMTLVLAAQTWFQNLPVAGTRSFTELVGAFRQQFASSKKQPVTSFSLLNVKQAEKESLREYVGRFNKILIEMPSATPDLLVGAFTRGLKGGDFFNSLVKKQPVTFEELLIRAEKYINLEEVTASRRGEEKPARKNPPDPREDRAPPKSRRLDPPRAMGPSVRQIALRVSRSRALQLCDERGLVQRPRGDRGPSSPASGTYCDFHRQYGHNTDDCRNLDEELERISKVDHDIAAAIIDGVPLPPAQKRRGEREEPLRNGQGVEDRTNQRGDRGRGRLGYLVKGPIRNNRRSPPARGPRDNQPTRGVIRIISGGPSYGDSNRARKSASRRLASAEVKMVARRGPTICFVPEDFHGGTDDHEDALVINAVIANYQVERIFVDNGSSANVLYKEAMDQMNLGRYKLEKVETELFGFTGHYLKPLGMLQLPMTIGTPKLTSTKMISFVVIDHESSYNVIFGRPAINTFRAIPSALHQKMKFLEGNEVGEVLGDRVMARKCYVQEVRLERKASKAQREDGPRSCARERLYSINSVGPVAADEELEEVVLEPPCGSVKVARDLPKELKEAMIGCLRRNKDVFAWSASDLVGIDRVVMEHKLSVAHEVRPVFQKKRNFGVEQNAVIREQVQELLEAGHIREVQFPTWLSNIVLVPKSSGKWRMCVDFWDLNKACPKDCYPLPRFDQLVDSTAGHEYLCFLDAYQGYHQINLAKEDQEKVSFITNEGTFCYVVMPFGLKNAGATYQRLMDKIFKEQSGRNIEVYVDDILIKSRTADCFLADLEETFSTTRRYGLKLNPAKCAFGVRSGKFLGYMVTRRGIEANPEKVQALINMTSPRNLNQVQQLTGRITALSQFISRSADRSLPFFKVLRKSKNFEWDDQSEKAFQELKEYLKELPVLNKPVLGEKLMVYLAVSRQAVSSVLVREEGTKHHPIYFVSYALKGSELNYTVQEKLAFSLVLTARRLRPYFLSHQIIVLTNSTLGKFVSHPDVSGRLVKWVTELGEFDIQFHPRTSIKAQVLADFLAETLETVPEEQWQIHVDGSACSSGCGVGIVLVSPWGEETRLAVRLDFRGTNNVVEYEALLIGLHAAKAMGAKRISLLSDSELVVQQANGNFEVKDKKMISYVRALEVMKEDFEELTLKHTSRENNRKADDLAKFASAMSPPEHLGAVPTELISQIDRINPGVYQIQLGDWRYDVYSYLSQQVLPEEEAKRREVQKRATRFVLLDGTLYKKSYSRPLLKCLPEEEAKEVLRDIHEGTCGSHLGSISLARKALIAGFYWPTMQKDALNIVRSCYNCQVHSDLQHVPATPMQSILSSCPFDQWGIDLVGKLPNTPGQRRHLIVAIDYFSKWVEAEAVAKTTQDDIIRFLWKNIVCRFGIPRRLISDNGPQFSGSKIQAWCKKWKIEQKFSSVYRPQTNGQVEVTNRTIVKALKARILEKEGSWADELQSVLWSFRTTPRAGTNETPFSLVYGSEAVLPAEVGKESARILGYSRQNSQLRGLELDLVQEHRDRALVRLAAYQGRMARVYNQKVIMKKFEIGDLVMREIQHKGARGKLQPKYEGPFKVAAKAGIAAYYLENARGERSNRPWNVQLLRKYYA